MPIKTARKEAPRRTLVSPPKNYCYGWLPDIPDHRDHAYEASEEFLRALPRRVDLRKYCPPVYKQLSLHSCTANAIAAAIQFDQIRHARAEKFRPSRLFIYYNERARERTILSDSGARIRGSIKTVAKRGLCPEQLWPYRIRRFRDKPERQCYTDAVRHAAMTYQRVRRALPELRACLASGYPFIFGFTVYESFHAPKVTHTGHGSMPLKRERVLAAHAALAVGYDDAESRFLLRNSWGTKWGMGGYFTLPYDYLMSRHLSQDFWTIRVRSAGRILLAPTGRA
ncbi:MAG: C1 family peptidase [Verrucomicrobiota bacterium]|nr:C1 family peptidase [Verrucomicrobiota bacterium]